MSNQHVPVALSPPDHAFGLMLDGHADTAVVFVHGFLGNARTTWGCFAAVPADLRSRFPFWERCDLLFYSYRSVQQIVPLANHLRQWLSRHLLAPDGKSKYDRVILVGHSTGAVLIRHVVLQEIEATESTLPILRASLRLFAPAHFGAIVAGPIGIVLNAPVTSLLGALFLRWRPLYHNLVKPDVIETLRQRTEELCATRSERALRACCLFGDDEEIVQVETYRNDYRHPTVPLQNHTSICKPSPTYQLPLVFVEHVEP